MPDVDGMIFGMYAEDDIKFFEDRLTVTPGVRFDWYDYDPKSTASFEDSPNYNPAYLQGNNDFGISPKLRLGWKATQELELFAQYARGFRAPTATELYQNYGAPGSYARIGNPDLETETSNGFEIGAKYDAADYSFKATAFNNYYKNFIDTVTIAPPGGEYPVGGITGYENLNHVRIYGIELGGEWRFDPSWRTWGSFAYSHGKDTDTGDYLNSVAPLRAIIGLGYSAQTWGSDVSLTLASSRNKVSGTGFEAPGYGLVDTTVWWAPEKVGSIDLTGLKVQAGVFNVFDKKYFDAVSVPDGVSASAADFYSEAGRSFKLSVTKKF
jgi:hemoglobin/transferrin/lactoferrin receptor protein